MTPKEKALQLINSCEPFVGKWSDEDVPFSKISNQKNVALLIVNEIIQALDAFRYTGDMLYYDFETGGLYTIDQKDPTEYWNKVRTIIKWSELI